MLRNFLHINPKVTLIIVLGVAALLRVLFFSGLVSPADVTNLASIAQVITSLKGGLLGFGDAFQEARTALGSLRNLALYLPNAAVFYALGVSTFSIHALPVTASLANILLIYAITKAVSCNETAAILAGLIWAFFPLEIFYSTATLRVIYTTFLFLLGVWSAAVAVQASQRWAFILFGIPCGLLFLWEPWLLAALMVMAVYLNSHMLSSYRLPLTALFGILGFLIFFASERVGDVFIDFYSLLLAQGEMVFILPFFFTALTVVGLERRKESILPSIWVISLFLAFVGKEITEGVPRQIDLFSVGAFLCTLLAAFPVMIGIYLGKMLPSPTSRVYVTRLACIGLLAATLAIWGVDGNFLPSFRGFDWIGIHSLFLVFSILSGVAFFGVIMSPFFLYGVISKRKTSAAVALLFLILLAGLPFAWNRRNEHHYLYDAVEKALTHLAQTSSVLSIYVLEPELEHLSELLSYSGRATISNDLLFTIANRYEIPSGFMLAFDNEQVIPPNWLELAKFGQLGSPRLVLYSLQTSGSQSGKKDYGALLNRGEFCEAYITWKTAMMFSPNSLSTIPYQAEADCIVPTNSLVHVLDLRTRANIQDYLSFKLEGVGEDELSIYHPTRPVYDMRTITVNLPLEPNSLYLYSIDVLSSSPVATLHWKWSDQEDYFRLGTYPQWTTLSVLLMTPDWDSPQTVSFSPVLFDHLDDVMVRNFYIGKVGFPE